MSKKVFSLVLTAFLLIMTLQGSPAEDVSPWTEDSSFSVLQVSLAEAVSVSSADGLPAEQETASPAFADPETVSPEPSDPSAQTQPSPASPVIGPAVFPKVIDRITDPSASLHFGFEEEDLLEIWFPPIRDQDCTIFRYQDQVWMLDCGDERAEDQIVPLLKELGIERINRLFNTHPHHDHLNGLYAVDASVPVEELLICFPEDSTKHMTAAMEYCRGNRIPVTHFEDEAVFSMGDGLVTFTAWMKTDEEESMNDRSAQFMVTYGSCSMLFMADMELRGQRQLFEALPAETLKADILRYPHHGKLGMVDDLFNAVSPSLVIITNVMRGIDLRESTKYLGYKHMPTAYTNMSEYVIRLRTDGHHWLCDLVPFTLAPQPSASPEEPGAEASPAPSSDSTVLPDPGPGGTPAP